MKKKIIFMGSDTVSGIAPALMNAIFEASQEKTLPYGNDVFTKKCKKTISEVFENDNLDILPMMSGTASNSLALASFLRSYGSVLCHSLSHINKDEGGAPEFFSGGGKLLNIVNKLNKLNAIEIDNKIKNFNLKNSNYSNLAGVSITQLAENGTIYSKHEILAISEVCKKYKLYLHMDGARFANALAFQKVLSPAQATWKIGVDCLSLGATKNGAMAAELIIFFDKKLALEAKKLIKQTGHLIPKARFITAQFNAWFQDGLWLKLANSANEKARYLSQKLLEFSDFKLMHPVQGNEIFLKIKKNTYESLLNLKIVPNLWNKINDEDLIVRFVTSFETQNRDIDEIINRINFSKKFIVRN